MTVGELIIIALIMLFARLYIIWTHDAIKSVIEEDNLTDSFATWFKWTLLVVLSVSLFLIIKYWNYKLL